MIRAVILGMLFCALATAGWAQVPETMNYQGIVTDISGIVVPDGLYDLTFRIYSAETGGQPLWTEAHTGAAVSKGIFNIILGSLVPLAESQTPFDKQYWLGIEVNGGGEAVPRIPLTSATYSFNARSVADSAVPEKNKWLANRVTSRVWDPVSGQVDFKKSAARIEKL